MSRKSVQRRSALSFAGADDSIDHYIDNIVQSDPWKHVEKIEKSDAARIQSVLNEFNDRITQEKTCKAGLNVTKKNSKQPTESVIKSSTEDLITTNSEGTSSNMHNDILVSKTKDQTRKKTSKKQAPETVEETSSQELQHVVDDIKKTSKKKGRKTSESNVKEIVVNESVKKTNKKDVINMIGINPQTSTPKQKLPTTVEKTAKDGKSIVRKRKMTDSENKSEKCIKPEGKKQRKRTSKKNAKDIEHCQDEVSKNMPSNGEKIMNMEEVKNLECSKENHNALKSEKKSNKKVSDKNNHLQAEESKNISENKMKCNVVDNQCEIKNICKKLKKLKNKNELPKNVTSNKSSKPLKSKVENIKCQCKKKCAENCAKDEQCLLKTREQLEKRREHKKSKKAAKAMAKLSHEISTVKKKMESIKNDLESSESSDSSDYSDDRLYSSSYSSYSGSSYSSDYNSSDFTSDDTEYTSDSSDSSTYSEDTNTSESKRSR